MNVTLKLFSSGLRADASPASHGEDVYSFLERSSRPTAAKVRDLLDDWFDSCPSSAKSELRDRFRDDFHAAFLELFLHETFTRSGWKMIPHPTVPGTTKTPDFLAEREGIRFYLEAKVARDRSAAEQARESIQHAIYDAINEIPSPNFFVRIKRLEVMGSDYPSLSALKTFLQRELARHQPPPDGAPRDAYRLRDLATISYHDEKVEIDISLIPRSPSARGRTDIRTIGFYPIRSRVGGTKDAIRDAVKRKGTRYGDLDLPYIVAVNCVSEWGVSEEDMLDGLFGDEQLTVPREFAPVEQLRARNGAWFGPSKPILTRVSAAIIACIYPWTLANSQCSFIHNPWARRPLIGVDHPFVSGTIVGNQIAWEAGRDLLEFFGLKAPWPDAD